MIHGNTFYSCNTPSLLGTPFILFQLIVAALLTALLAALLAALLVALLVVRLLSSWIGFSWLFLALLSRRFICHLLLLWQVSRWGLHLFSILFCQCPVHTQWASCHHRLQAGLAHASMSIPLTIFTASSTKLKLLLLSSINPIGHCLLHSWASLINKISYHQHTSDPSAHSQKSLCWHTVETTCLVGTRRICHVVTKSCWMIHSSRCSLGHVCPL